MPKELRDTTELYGVELDSISGSTSHNIYTRLRISRYVDLKNQILKRPADLILGNVPFGDYKPYDPKYKNKKLKIHDYFIMKSLDLLKPGGILAVVTSKGTLDKSSNRIRKDLAEQADLLASIHFRKALGKKCKYGGYQLSTVFSEEKGKNCFGAGLDFYRTDRNKYR